MWAAGHRKDMSIYVHHAAILIGAIVGIVLNVGQPFIFLAATAEVKERKRRLSPPCCICVYVYMCICVYVYVCMCICVRMMCCTPYACVVLL